VWTLTCVCNRWITPSSDTPTGRFRSSGDSSLPVHAAAPTASLDPTDIKAIRERVQAKIASLNGTNARVGDMLSKTAPVEVGGCLASVTYFTPLNIERILTTSSLPSLTITSTLPYATGLAVCA
jgi:hypothetical protein